MCHVLWRALVTEEMLTNQMIRVTCLVDVSQAVSSTTSSWHNGAMNGVILGTEREAVGGPHSMHSLLNKTSLVLLLLNANCQQRRLIHVDPSMAPFWREQPAVWWQEDCTKSISPWRRQQFIPTRIHVCSGYGLAFSATKPLPVSPTKGLENVCSVDMKFHVTLP